MPAKIEIIRDLPAAPVGPQAERQHRDSFEKIDLDTVKFTLDLPPQSKKVFEYTLTTYQGVRAEDWGKRQQQRGQAK